jgi:prophage endopeptidase
MNTFLRWANFLIGVCIAIFSAAISAAVVASYYGTQIANLQRKQAEAIALARADDIETLKLSKRHGDALTLQLQVTESTLTKKEKELHDAIRAQTTGRACLSGRTVSLLNNSGTTDGSTHLPATSASTAAADGAFATDTDIAQWAANARTQYDICRARLNALIDW